MPQILVIDDDPAIAEMLQDTLLERGYLVHTCGDGKQVQNLMANTHYDLIILDLLIPHVNGFTLIEQIRADPTSRELPVIMMSGIYRARNHRSEMIQKYSVLDYLDKPLKIPELVYLVAEHIGPGEAPRTPPPREHLPGTKPSPHKAQDARLVDPETKAERQDVEHEARTSFVASAFLKQGSIEDNPVSALLGKLWGEKRSGALLLRQGRNKKIIYLRNGSAYAVKSNMVSECLGQVLVGERLISTEECRQSVETMKATGRRQGEILVGMRSMTEKNLVFALELQLETKLFEAFRWTKGDYRFNGSAEMPEPSTSLQYRGAAVVVEGIRRTFDETRLRGLMLPVFEVAVAFQDAHFNFTTLGLSTRETKGIFAMRLPLPIGEVVGSMPLDPPDALRVVYTLIALELLVPQQ